MLSLNRSRSRVLLLAAIGLALAVPARRAVAQQPDTSRTSQEAPKHHSKAKGAAAGAAGGAVVGGKKGAVVGAGAGAAYQHHRNKKARKAKRSPGN